MGKINGKKRKVREKERERNIKRREDVNGRC